jgi:hypothetical protein
MTSEPAEGVELAGASVEAPADPSWAHQVVRSPSSPVESPPLSWTVQWHVDARTGVRYARVPGATVVLVDMYTPRRLEAAKAVLTELRERHHELGVVSFNGDEHVSADDRSALAAQQMVVADDGTPDPKLDAKAQAENYVKRLRRRVERQRSNFKRYVERVQQEQR